MRLSSRDIENLLIYLVGVIARERLNRGLRINFVEAEAYIIAAVMDYVREQGAIPNESNYAPNQGAGPSNIPNNGWRLLFKSDVKEKVADMLTSVSAELTLPDGIKRVTLNHPIIQ
ncbi:urease subunit gamma [Martelella alba]|uniref:Urease subunit gamma n=1 Tax=Martelella alba TaxID=2590451 RepID=A0ABY2SPH6_9HYPH|nr:urease subunit gamma [Martelella alba]TKI07781.1 urease subunit gamma [Martelella alba]